MKRLILSIFLLSVLACDAGELWMNQTGGFVRHEKPTTIILDGLQTYSLEFSDADLAKAGYAKLSYDCDMADLVYDFQAGTVRGLTAEEKQAQLEAGRIEKDAFILATEALYTNLLTSVGHAGAWADMSKTYQAIGLDMVGRGLVVESLFLDKLYNILLAYWTDYGGSDLRLYPWGSQYVLDPTGQISE